MSDELISDLIAAIDEAAQYLLKQARASPKNAEGEVPAGVEPATLAEQVKAFQAVVAWADKRRDLIPKEKTESKFDRLSSQFSGSSTKRRASSRGRAASSNGADHADSSAGDDAADHPTALDS